MPLYYSCGRVFNGENRMKIWRFGFALLLLQAVFGSLLLFGQTTTATISGTVADTSGAVVPEVSVQVLNKDTGVSRSLKTDSGGRYTATDLPIGNYEVSAEMSGFQKEVREGIVLT